MSCGPRSKRMEPEMPEIPACKGDGWPIGIRLEVLDGETVSEKFVNAAAYGFDAVELPGRGLADFQEELLACRSQLALPVSSISLGFRGSLLSADAAARRQCCDDIKSVLSLCAELGAVGMVMPPVLHMDNHPRITDAGEQSDVRAAEDALLLEQLPELADSARDTGTLILLEPVCQAETDYLNTLGRAAALCERFGREELGVTADFYHMQLEESDPLEALRQAGRWIKHVHVGSSVRTEPDPESLDLAPGMNVLREIGYCGYVVAECRSLSGDPATVLPRSAAYLRTVTAPGPASRS